MIRWALFLNPSVRALLGYEAHGVVGAVAERLGGRVAAAAQSAAGAGVFVAALPTNSGSSWGR